MTDDKTILIDQEMVEVHQNFDGHLVVNRLWLRRKGYEGLLVIDRNLVERAVTGIVKVQRSPRGTFMDTLLFNPILDVTLKLEDPGHLITLDDLRNKILGRVRKGTVYDEVEQNVGNQRAKLMAAKDFDEMTEILGISFRP